MGRLYLADTSVQQCIDDMLLIGGATVGLVIGQMSTSRDFIVQLAATPAMSEEDKSDQCNVAQQPKKYHTLDVIDDKYVTNHARQVTRMLTGGFDVIGLFACTKPDEWKTAQVKLRQVLYSIHSMINKKESAVSGRVHTHRLLLHICSLTKKLMCRTYDVSDHKSGCEPAELKFQRSAEEFIQLETKYSLGCVIPVTASSMAVSLNKQILTGLQPVFKAVWDSLVLINDQLVPESSEPMVAKSVDKDSRGRRKPRNEIALEPSSFSVNLLQDMVPMSCDETVTVLDCAAKLVVNGTITSRVCVHSRCSVSEAIQVLKRDVLRSIVARCELLCEDLLLTEEDQDDKVLYEMPMRVFASLPTNSSVVFSDYLFPYETVDDSAIRFRDLIGVEIEGDNIDITTEHLPTDAEVDWTISRSDSPTGSRTDESPLLTVSSSRACQYVGLVVGVIVACLAAVVMYIYSMSMSSSSISQRDDRPAD